MGVEFGPGIFYINNKPIGTGILDNEVDIIPEEPEFDYAHIPPITLSKPIELELESTLNVPLIKELAGHFSEPKGFYLEYDGVRYEQVRKHKKKRINKKWAKRYGYREVPCRYRMENAYIKHELFNDFSIVADPPKIVKGW